MSKIFGKDGLIPNEPLWKNWEKFPPEKFASKVGDMLNFYNSHIDKSDLKNDLLEWMAHQEFNKSDVSKVRSRYDEIPFTAAKIARAINVGMPEEHPLNEGHQKSTTEFLKKSINHVLNSDPPAKIEKNDEAPESKQAPKISPMERLRNKVESTVVADLNVMIDEWIMASSNQIAPIDIVAKIKSNEIPPKGIPIIREWINRSKKEIDLAREGNDPDLTEGYSYLGKRALNAWSKNLQKMNDDLDKYERKLKQQKKKSGKSKSTQKKQTAAQLAKQVAKVSYQSSIEISPSLILESIQPIEILGSRFLFTFNSKYRRISFFAAKNRDGLSIKGTTLQNFDTDQSFSLVLRNPEKVLNMFLDQSSKSERVLQELDKENTKRNVPNGRLGQNTVLLAKFK